jgi:hypothetical protein
VAIGEKIVELPLIKSEMRSPMNIKEIEYMFQLMGQYRISEFRQGDVTIIKTIHQYESTAEPKSQAKKSKDPTKEEIMTDPDLYNAVT